MSGDTGEPVGLEGQVDSVDGEAITTSSTLVSVDALEGLLTFPSAHS